MSEAVPSLRELKSRAQLTPVSIRLGKAGASPEFLTAFNETLDLRELVKLRFEGLKDERKSIARQLAETTNSQLVQQVGHTAVFFRKRAGG